MAIRVPDTNTFKLSDVIAAVEDHAGAIDDKLTVAFSNSIDSYFDPLYKGSKDRQSNFRSYGPVDDSLSCGTDKNYSGAFVFPYRVNINLGTGSGSVSLNFNAYDLPELYLVHYNGSIVINTGFRGHANFDYGGSLRYSVSNTLVGRVDPIHGNTFPDTTNYPDDGYPRVTSPGNGSSSFYKSSTNEIARVEVWSAVDDVTQWNFTLGCPV